MNKSPEEYIDGLTGTNDKYDTRQTTPLYGYQTSDKQFPNPEGEVVFSGFGANAEDLERGWIKCDIRQNPEYEMSNHKLKWTEYRIADEDGNGGMDLPPDFEFRMKDRETKGLFVRPHIPTER